MNSAQNNSSSQPANTGQNPSSDDSLAKLQAQVAALQNQKNIEEKQEAEEFNKKPEPEEEPELEEEFITDKTPPAISNQMAGIKPKASIQTPQTIPTQIQQKPPTPIITQDRTNKERKDQLVGSPTPERIPYKEVQTEFESPAELEPWMEEKPDPKEMTLPKPVEDDFGDILVEASQVPKPNIILPMDEEEIKKGLHYKIIDSIRWLAEWCKRNILTYPKRVFYNNKKSEENKNK